MRRELYRSKYAVHQYDERNFLLLSFWTSESEHMNEKEVREEMLAWAQISEQCKPKRIFDRCKDFLYPLSPELQAWIAETLNPKWVEMGVEKYASVEPEDLIVEISNEQLLEEFLKMKKINQFEIKTFHSDELAMRWLLS